MKTIVDDTKLSYLGRKLQGYFNSKKEEFLKALKQRGSFIECCEHRGFIYALSITAFNEEICLQVGLKNGEITIYQLRRQSNLKKAI